MLEKYRRTMPPEVKDEWASDAESRITELEAELEAVGIFLRNTANEVWDMGNRPLARSIRLKVADLGIIP